MAAVLGPSVSNIDPLSDSNPRSNADCPINNKAGAAAGYIINSNRAKNDITDVMKDAVAGVTAAPCDDVYCTQVVIIGSADTPYEGGFFHFFIRFGPQYPARPPHVCSMSSYRFGQVVRFSPNLYEDGHVCLSLLGTWQHGPQWEAVRTLNDVLLGLQSLFIEQSLCNEPGYESLRDGGGRDVWVYDMYVRHETLRVSVLHTLSNVEALGIPERLVAAMTKTFFEKYEFYLSSCDSYSKYDGTLYQIIYPATRRFIPKFGTVKKELMSLHSCLSNQAA